MNNAMNKKLVSSQYVMPELNDEFLICDHHKQSARNHPFTTGNQAIPNEIRPHPDSQDNADTIRTDKAVKPNAFPTHTKAEESASNPNVNEGSSNGVTAPRGVDLHKVKFSFAQLLHLLGPTTCQRLEREFVKQKQLTDTELSQICTARESISLDTIRTAQSVENDLPITRTAQSVEQLRDETESVLRDAKNHPLLIGAPVKTSEILELFNSLGNAMVTPQVIDDEIHFQIQEETDAEGNLSNPIVAPASSSESHLDDPIRKKIQRILSTDARPADRPFVWTDPKKNVAKKSYIDKDLIIAVMIFSGESAGEIADLTNKAVSRTTVARILDGTVFSTGSHKVMSHWTQIYIDLFDD